MDKAQVIREFLGWVDKTWHWSLSEGENCAFDEEVEQAIQEFVASQEQASQDGARLDAIIDGQFGGIPEMMASVDEPVCMNDWSWKRASKYPAPLHEEPTTYYISPEWTPTPETLRQWKEAWGERAKC